MIISPNGEQPKQHVWAHTLRQPFTKFRLYMLYKTWGYYNKFDSIKSLWVYYWYVKIPQCGYMEYGLKDVAFYVQKHIAPWEICYNTTPPPSSQHGARGTCICETHLLITHRIPSFVESSLHFKKSLGAIAILTWAFEMEAPIIVPIRTNMRLNNEGFEVFAYM